MGTTLEPPRAGLGAGRRVLVGHAHSRRLNLTQRVSVWQRAMGIRCAWRERQYVNARIARTSTAREQGTKYRTA